MADFRMVDVSIGRLEWIGSNTLLIGTEATESAGLTFPGQFFMVRGWSDCSPLWNRPFSICDVSDKELLFMVRVFGRASRCLSRKKVGDDLSLIGPLGNRVELNSPGTDYVLVAGGIGLAPFPLLVRSIRKEYPDAGITLVYGEKTGSLVVDINGLFGTDVDIIITTDDGSLGKRSTTVDACAELLREKHGSIVFACGPKCMLKAIQNHPVCSGYELNFFMEELMACGFGTCMGCITEMRDGSHTFYARVCRDGPVFDGKKVIL